MNFGDKLEWRGLCKTHQGVIVKGENGRPLVKMDDGKFFLLKDVQNSKSLKVIKA
jgi:hypothetical protein